MLQKHHSKDLRWQILTLCGHNMSGAYILWTTTTLKLLPSKKFTINQRILLTLSFRSLCARSCLLLFTSIQHPLHTSSTLRLCCHCWHLKDILLGDYMGSTPVAVWLFFLFTLHQQREKHKYWDIVFYFWHRSRIGSKIQQLNSR